MCTDINQAFEEAKKARDLKIQESLRNLQTAIELEETKILTGEVGDDESKSETKLMKEAESEKKAFDDIKNLDKKDILTEPRFNVEEVNDDIKKKKKIFTKKRLIGAGVIVVIASVIAAIIASND